MRILFLLLAGCTSLPEQEATVLQGAYFNWTAVNHRLSYLHLALTDPGAASVSVIGGTSTTNQRADLDDGCDSATCIEIPANDSATVRLGWASIITSEVGLGTGRVSLEVGADGGTGSAEVELPDGAKGEVTALLRGLVLNTDHPVEGEANCYRPVNGWHPRAMTVSIDEVSDNDDGTVTVRISGAFAAGSTEDPQRACIDDVHERAVVNLDVEVLVVQGHESATEETVTNEAVYPFSGNQFNPESQEEATPTALTTATEDALVGWSRIDFRFNPENDAMRGVYLRSWGFEVGAGGAVGIATNFSPGTQLHDMAYAFSGDVRVVSGVGGEIETGTLEDTLNAGLNESGGPVVYQRDL